MNIKDRHRHKQTRDRHTLQTRDRNIYRQTDIYYKQY